MVGQGRAHGESQTQNQRRRGHAIGQGASESGALIVPGTFADSLYSALFL